MRSHHGLSKFHSFIFFYTATAASTRNCTAQHCPSLSSPILCASLRSFWSPAFATCQMSWTVSSLELDAALLGLVHFLSPE